MIADETGVPSRLSFFSLTGVLCCFLRILSPCVLMWIR
jgi:hypothetical protein